MIEWLAFILPGAVVLSGISWAMFRVRAVETESATSVDEQDDHVADPSEAFEAWTTCPKCRVTDFHVMREPLAPTDEQIAAWEKALSDWAIERDNYDASGGDQTEIKMFSGNVFRTVRTGFTKPRPPQPIDETEFDVIRLCTNCEHEWGQK